MYRKYVNEKNLSEFSKCKHYKDNYHCWCKQCKKKYNKQWKIKNPEYKKVYDENNKEKNKEYRERTKDRITEIKEIYYKNNIVKILKYQQEYCKNNKEKLIKRRKIWNEENKEYKKEYSKKYYENNKEQIAERKKIYHENNKEHKKEYDKKYYNSKANYDTFALQISWDNNPIRNIDGYLQTKCTYCGKWYFPVVSSVQYRITALNGKASSDGTENRLYCSDECKQVCPIFHKKTWPKGFKNYSNVREVQPELRQMVFERDEYTCIKCGKNQDELTVPLHCHHIEGIVQNPIMSADIDICVTVCKICHKEIHQEDGCGYNDMKCKN